MASGVWGFSTGPGIEYDVIEKTSGVLASIRMDRFLRRGDFEREGHDVYYYVLRAADKMAFATCPFVGMIARR